ncbi:hypothetical protein DFH07DRAFT_1062784 [Mycena maculata]|uniref:F-box domain-containing protein n=1 Tax=Mycena maculata TaxID=230809 RepID=A0AAD7IRA8_9AGAR|nr:hypothetical protein DFH07DRAFT_1062784 [Mycena maculata]
MAPSVLHIQELLDHCISLQDSKSDLVACALVSRRWVHRAQSLLFEEINPWDIRRSIDDHRRRWLQLLPILNTCPHLVRYIRRLSVNQKGLSTQIFSEICLVRFTHLEDVTVRTVDLPPPHAVGMQALLSLPTLLRVDIECSSANTRFIQIWCRCSPSIRTIALGCFLYFDDHFDFILPDPPTPLKLESLSLTFADDGVTRWLQHDVCPFDLSRLRVLSFGYCTEIVRSPAFVAALRTIEALEFKIPISQDSIDFSAFPKLASVRVRIFAGHEPWSKTLESFATIAPSCSISIFGFFEEGTCNQLDSVLSQTLLPPSTVEIHADASNARAVAYFPELKSMNMLRLTAYDPDWPRLGAILV